MLTTGNKVDALPVMETFYSIQGEGYHQGAAAHFVRLGGCDVGCHWCDVKESWDVKNFPVAPCKSIVAELNTDEAEMVVVTGGEPAMYDLGYLTVMLKEAGYRTHLETSGAYPITGAWDWICLSPKKFKAPLEENLPLADELKVVVYNRSDFSWGESFASRVEESCKLYLQPEWSRRKTMMNPVVEYIKANPSWSISLQIHKYLNVR